MITHSPKVAAISTTCVLVEFEVRRESAKYLEMKLIESFRKIASSAPTHREFFRSGTPFEPILAEAAAQYLAEISNVPEALVNYRMDMYKDAFVRFTYFARFDKGGEVNSRTILAAFVRGWLSSVTETKSSLILSFLSS